MKNQNTLAKNNENGICFSLFKLTKHQVDRPRISCPRGGYNIRRWSIHERPRATILSGRQVTLTTVHVKRLETRTECTREISGCDIQCRKYPREPSHNIWSYFSTGLEENVRGVCKCKTYQHNAKVVSRAMLYRRP